MSRLRGKQRGIVHSPSSLRHWLMWVSCSRHSEKKGLFSVMTDIISSNDLFTWVALSGSTSGGASFSFDAMSGSSSEMETYRAALSRRNRAGTVSHCRFLVAPS